MLDENRLKDDKHAEQLKGREVFHIDNTQVVRNEDTDKYERDNTALKRKIEELDDENDDLRD